MIITLCGKGGCGKSTISSLLAKEFVRNGKKVLVIDTDESNYGLHRQLGLELPKDFTNYFGGKKAVIAKLRAPKGAETLYFDKPWSLSDIPSEYISEKDGVELIAIGKIHEAGEGCACPMGIVSREFISNLSLNPDEVVITDTEAGIEHFGRNVEKDADAVLMVVDPSYESLKLSEKVSELGKSMDKPVYFVLNKVDSSNENIMRDAVGKSEEIIAVMPSENKIALSGLTGEELKEEYPEIKKLAKFLSDNLA